MWKQNIGNENSPIVTKEWNRELEYWKRVLDALNGICNDITSLDERDSSSDDFFPKTRKNVNTYGNTLHAISSIIDGDFDNVIDELIYVGLKCNKPKPTFDPRIDVEKERCC